MRVFATSESTRSCCFVTDTEDVIMAVQCLSDIMARDHISRSQDLPSSVMHSASINDWKLLGVRNDVMG